MTKHSGFPFGLSDSNLINIENIDLKNETLINSPLQLQHARDYFQE